MRLEDAELMTEAKNLGAPFELLKFIRKTGRLPVPNFAAGGIATPSDAALVMQLGAESVFVGSGIFKSERPEAFAKAIVKTVLQFDQPSEILAASMGLSAPMPGLEIQSIPTAQRLAARGW